jgi:hypothetical protein
MVQHVCVATTTVAASWRNEYGAPTATETTKQDWFAGRQPTAIGTWATTPGDEGKEDGNDEDGWRDGIATSAWAQSKEAVHAPVFGDFEGVGCMPWLGSVGGVSELRARGKVLGLLGWEGRYIDHHDEPI